jgi:hypothetical protein
MLPVGLAHPRIPRAVGSGLWHAACHQPPAPNLSEGRAEKIKRAEWSTAVAQPRGARFAATPARLLSWWYVFQSVSVAFGAAPACADAVR